MGFATADLSDAYPDEVQICDPLLRDFGGRDRFAGEIVTLKCFEDNSLVRTALEQPGAGQVLVVDAGGSLRCAMLGDLLAEMAVANRWEGVIVYGCIRDAARMAELPLGVKALTTHPRKSVKLGAGQVGLPVRFAGVEFHPRAFVHCDRDGILVAARPLA
jgi:regulator of ribonuclease activity A